jgi:anti-sigma B factor antagonist
MIQASPFEIRTDLESDRACLRLAGELDIASAPALDEAVRKALGEGVDRVLLDLAGLTFVDSSGLRLFIMLNARAKEDGWTLEMTRPPEPSLSVFRLTGSEENLPFVADRESR